MHSSHKAAAAFLLVWLTACCRWTAVAAAPDILGVGPLYVRSHSIKAIVNVTDGTNMDAYNVVVLGDGGASIPVTDEDVFDDNSYAVTVVGLNPFTTYTFQYQLIPADGGAPSSAQVPLTFRTAPFITNVSLVYVKSHSIKATVSATAGIKLDDYIVNALVDGSFVGPIQQVINDDNTYSVVINSLNPLFDYQMQFILSLAGSDTVYSEQRLVTFTTAPALRSVDLVSVRSHSIKTVINVTSGINMDNFAVIAMTGGSVVDNLQQTVDDTDLYAVSISSLTPFTNYTLLFVLKMANESNVYSNELSYSFQTMPAITGLDLSVVSSHSIRATLSVTPGIDMDAYNVAMVGFGASSESLDQEPNGDKYDISLRGLDPSINYKLQFILRKANDDTAYSNEFDQDLLTAPAIQDINVNRIAPHSIYATVNVTAGTNLTQYTVVVTSDQRPIDNIEQMINDVTSYTVNVHGLIPTTNFTMKYRLRLNNSNIVYSDVAVLPRFATGAGIEDVGLISADAHSATIRVNVSSGADMTAFVVVVLGDDDSIFSSETSILDASSYSVVVKNLVPSTNYSLSVEVHMRTDARVYSGQGAINFMTESNGGNVVAIAVGSAVGGVALLVAIIFGVVFWRRRFHDNGDKVYLQMDNEADNDK